MRPTDIPTGPPQPDVEDAIRAARADQIEAPALFRALAEAPLVLAIASSTDEAVQPFVFEWNDADHGAVFTRPELMVGLPEGTGYVEVAGRDLAAGWPDGLMIALNPGTDDLALVLDPSAMKHIAAGGMQPGDDMLEAGQAVQIGAPVEPPPDEFVEAVRTAVREADQVDAAYVFMLVDAHGTPRLMTGARLVDGADDTAVMTALVGRVSQLYTPGGDIDFIVLGDDLLPVVTQFAEPIN